MKLNYEYGFHYPEVTLEIIDTTRERERERDTNANILSVQPSKKKPRTAAQSEFMSIGKEKFLMLSRDSGSGHGSDSSESLYRQIDVLNLAGATDIKGTTFDAKASSSITTADDSGVLKSGITPATYCPFVNMNDNTQLAKFGLHNGGAQNAALLNEKWEGLAMVPVDGLEGDDDWWYVIAVSDNDFITQNGTFVWFFLFCFVSFSFCFFSFFCCVFFFKADDDG